MPGFRDRPVRLFPAVAAGTGLVLALSAAAAPSPGRSATAVAGQLSGVAALSRSDAWAVGYRCVPGCTASSVLETLILHWDGSTWAPVASPSPGASQSILAGVTALSPSDAWAAGWYNVPSGGFRTLVLHWNGARWAQVPSPSPEVVDGSFLSSVSAVSATNVWAAGWYYGPGGESSSTLVLHWNGTRWSAQRSPSPSHLGFNYLNALSARSVSGAWAAGNDDNGTLLLRWSGTRWARVPGPSPGTAGSGALAGVTALSASDAWAVGGTGAATLTLHWNGTGWSRVPSPRPGGGGDLNAVSAVSAADVWAAGCYIRSASGTGRVTLVLRWDGTRWARLATPNPGGATGACLSGVSALSASDVWAVGATDPFQPGKTLILHWNGASWTRF